MGTKRDVDAVPRDAQPVDSHGLSAALRLFTASFVARDKQDQIYKRLLTKDRRLETLGTLPRWIAVRTAPLEGADQSPSGLQARFGELIGVQLDGAGARRTSIAHALELARGTASLFVGDAGRVALITVESGPPLLCVKLL